MQRLESLSKGEEKQESATILELKNRIKAMRSDENLEKKIAANVAIVQVCGWVITLTVGRNGRNDIQARCVMAIRMDGQALLTRCISLGGCDSFFCTPGNS